jgi:hypothetical protein
VQQVLGYDKAQQFSIIEQDLPAWAAIPVMTQARQDTVGHEDKECGQEGVELIVPTKGLKPSTSH